jgi:CheY-like chemotaxis protein
MKDKARDKSKKPLLLLVDDVAENLQLLARQLGGDYEISFATSGKQALGLAADIHPDLILLDVMMPGMDGFETCSRLKQNRSTRAIPIIFLTARAENQNVLKGFEVGGVDYVAKPFRAPELRARVKTHVDLNRLKSFHRVCAQCQKIQNESEEWERLDSYIARNTKTEFSHGYCPECYAKVLHELGLD